MFIFESEKIKRFSNRIPVYSFTGTKQICSN